jgi:ribose 5-phosphate isomerase A
MAHDIQQDTWKKLAGNEAAKLVQDDMVIGLGTGSTANFFIYALANRVQQGLHLLGAVSSSLASQELAANLGIPITTLDAHPELDLYVDGADEIDPQLRLLKGAGGALLREKIVASSSKRFIVIADISKEVKQLGHTFPIPVETVPFAVAPVRRHLQRLGATTHIRQIAGNAFVTDNNNTIIDCIFPDGINDPDELDARIHSIVGVVETGLFLNFTSQVIIGGPDGVKILP